MLLIVDDHEDWCARVSSVLENRTAPSGGRGEQRRGGTRSCEEARPRVVIWTIGSPIVTAWRSSERSARFEATRILLCSGPRRVDARRSRAAGADGFVARIPERRDRGRHPQGRRGGGRRWRGVGAGGCSVTSATRDAAVEGPEPLGTRARGLSLLAEGLTNREIGVRLFISEKTGATTCGDSAGSRADIGRGGAFAVPLRISAPADGTESRRLVLRPISSWRVRRSPGGAEVRLMTASNER